MVASPGGEWWPLLVASRQERPPFSTRRGHHSPPGEACHLPPSQCGHAPVCNGNLFGPGTVHDAWGVHVGYNILTMTEGGCALVKRRNGVLCVHATTFGPSWDVHSGGRGKHATRVGTCDLCPPFPPGDRGRLLFSARRTSTTH